ncbi:MAG TPA: hypothetical protein VK961_14615 [Chthoniobacter sp.]|nr:hypothetical protein [Chthoniobacter sp.]
MASLLIRSTLLLTLAFASATAQELPRKSGPTDFDPEPKLMLNDVPDVPIPGAPFAAAAAGNQPPADVAKLEASLERAKKNAAWRERLAKTGVLSKVEAEQGQMTVVRLTKDLENARLDALKRELEERRKQPATDDAAKKTLEEIEGHLAAATTTAQDAFTKWQQAQRSAAEIRVWRERKLLSLGAGTKSAVKRAETALQALMATPAPAPIAAPPPNP